MAASISMGLGLQRRLLLLLLVPLLLLSLLNIWYDIRLADVAANQQDQQLTALLPQLASSVVSKGATEFDAPVVLMPPLIVDFLAARPGTSAMVVLDSEGRILAGDAWLSANAPETSETDFSSEEYQGVTYRIVSQRVKTAVGEVTVRLADGSDPRQQWLHGLWFKVLLPNLALAVGAVFAVSWAVRRALRPLIAIRDDVEGRSPQDLSPLDATDSPDEVLPLVQSLNRLFALVDAQAESQRRFVADAAHQLRTPLAALQSQVEAWAQLAQGRVNVTLSAEQILKLRHAARRTSQLATQLLALSRADARSANAQPMEQVDLKSLCEMVLEDHLDAAAEKRIDLGLEAMPVQANGYDWLLRELMANLVDNAIRYTPAGGHVTLRCGQRGDYPLGPLQPFLEVEDNGPGIPVASREKLLQRFYRLPGTPGEGNGLGLAIADEIARVHASALQLNVGAFGKGLRISLLLPLVTRASQVPVRE
jgi:two-component system sensor histidine kinase TctE